jgi:putative spermidine/putrescine transport system substrate-binding protein
MTFLKSFLYDFAGNRQALAGKFDEQRYRELSAKLWDYVRELRPYLWHEGKTFPSGVAQMHQLFTNGEIDFAMSNNDAEVDNKVLEGLFPPSCRAYVLDVGTIQNSHFMGIVKNAPSQAGAMVACNFLISPAAQYEKMKPGVWGDTTILDVKKLAEEWREKFKRVPERKLAPPRAEIQPKALMEPAPEYMIHLFEDFRQEIIEK